MLRAYFIELILACGGIFLLGWGAVKLYHIVRHESDGSHQKSRREKRDAEDALDDLEHAVQRAAKKSRRYGGSQKKG